MATIYEEAAQTIIDADRAAAEAVAARAQNRPAVFTDEK